MCPETTLPGYHRTVDLQSSTPKPVNSEGSLRSDIRSGVMIESLRSDVLLVRPLDGSKSDPDLSEIGEVLEFDKDPFVKIWAYIEQALRSIIEYKNKRVIVLWRYRDELIHMITSTDRC